MKNTTLTAFLAVLLIGFILTAGCTGSDQQKNNPNTAGMHETLSSLTSAVSSELEETGKDLIQTANALSPQNVSIGSDEASGYLNAYYISHPWVIDILAVDSGLIVSNAAPEARKDAIGENMSEYTQDREALKAGKMYLADVFELEEGSLGSAMSYPIFPETGYYYPGELGGMKGYVASGFRPAELINNAAPTLLAQTPYQIRVIQPDGTLIYDRDAYQLNRNVSSEVPADVLSLASGTVNDTIETDGKTKDRTTIWNTLSIGDTAWRIVVMSC
jgi:hypothetical protein